MKVNLNFKGIRGSIKDIRVERLEISVSSLFSVLDSMVGKCPAFYQWMKKSGKQRSWIILSRIKEADHMGYLLMVCLST